MARNAPQQKTKVNLVVICRVILFVWIAAVLPKVQSEGQMQPTATVTAG